MKKRVKRHAVVQPLDESYRLIPLTRNQNAIVDAADFEWLSKWNWQAMWCTNTRSFYAKRNESRKTILMHCIIINSSSGNVDHKNHNTLDNRRQNIRKATMSQNHGNMKKCKRNRSGFKGVRWCKDRNKWQATLMCDGKYVEIRRFDTPEEAAHAYDAAAIKYFGEFAHVNFKSI